MRIVRRVFEIGDNGRTEPLFDAELDEPLPLHYEVGDIVEELEERAEGNPRDPVDFEVCGLRTPQSKFVTLKRLCLPEEERNERLSAKRVRWVQKSVSDRVASGDLVVVKINSLPDEARVQGNKRAQDLYRHQMAASGRCQESAPALVEGMRDAGDPAWELVFGFALGEFKSRAESHVWVRKNNLHFDPTWDRPEVPLDQCRHYALSSRHSEVISLDGLDALRDRWQLCIPTPLRHFPLELSEGEVSDALDELVAEAQKHGPE